MECSCRRAPVSFGPEPKRLLLDIRFPHTHAKVAAALRRSGCDARVVEGVLDVHLDADAVEPFLDTLCASVTSAERDAIRAVILPAGVPATERDYLRADSLARLTNRVKSQWLVDAMTDGKTVSFFQPIFHAGGEPFAHEALLRIPRNGGYVSPGEAFRVAGDQDLSQYLDRIARETAIASASRAKIPGMIFINFLPSAIYDPKTCLSTTVEALERYNIDAGRIVFEVVESDRIHDPEHLRAIVDDYRRRGFQIALDDLGAGYSSFSLVSELHPDFVKLDMSLVQGVDRDPYKAVLAGRLIEAVKELGIRVIGEGIERPEELAWLRDRGVDFVQGFLLGVPSATG